MDTVLPFGLRSAPKIYNILADAIQFAALAQGIQYITHYLDNFVILGSPGSGQCGRDLSIFVELCESLGIPLAEEKIEDPSTKLEVLGIIIDTEYMQLSLSEERMVELRSLLQNWKGRKVATKREAQSLAGKLQHASRVVRLGRCFVHHIYDLIAEKAGPDQLVRLNREVRSDLQWCLTFMNTWYLTILGIQEGQPRRTSLVGCIRVIGLWGSITREVVPTPTDQSTKVTVNCSQGTYSDCVCLSSFGANSGRHR